jgi:hypothetical protein
LYFFRSVAPGAAPFGQEGLFWQGIRRLPGSRTFKRGLAFPQLPCLRGKGWQISGLHSWLSRPRYARFIAGRPDGVDAHPNRILRQILIGGSAGARLGSRPFRGCPHHFQFALAPRRMALPRLLVEPFAHLYRFQPELQGLKLGKPLPPLHHGQFYGLVEVGNFR